MKHGLLAAAFLLTSAGFASADYVILVANVGAEKELNTVGAGMAGMRGGMAGMAGMAGMRGGMAGMAGMQGGMAGMAGMQGGMRGGMAGMQGMQGGMRGGMAGMQGGMRGGMAGMQGGMAGMQGGMAGMAGMRGGMAGMAGMAGMRGGMAGMAGGMMGGTAASVDADDVPYFVIAVVEVKPSKKMVEHFNRFSENAPLKVALPARLGQSCYLLKKTAGGEIEMFIITEGKDKAIPTVSQRYQAEHDKVMKESPLSASSLLKLAELALKFGLLDEFPKVMKKLIEVDNSNRAAVAYQKVKADLDRPASNDASTASWRDKLLPGYKAIETPHYLIVQNARPNEIKRHADHLENTFHGFYYWFALHGIALPAPRRRQVVIVTSQKSDFDKLNKLLPSAPVVVDGFFARRENLIVMTLQRQDDTYQALKTYWTTWEDKGYKRHDLLETARSTIGQLKNAVPQNVVLAQAAALPKIAEAQMLALMLKALEQEAALATISHDASRQLLFASGLLPRNVAVPEWLLFGMGSFFETPLQSPWPTSGGPSPYYLPRWRELRNKGGLEATKLLTLRKVVSDGYFRSVPPDGKSDSAEHRLHEAALRKARTVSWSLTYFLAHKKLDGLRRYFAELSKMPRDLELDDTVLLGCFARAFGCVDGNNKVDEAGLSKLATEWYGYWQSVNFDSEPTMKDIREKIAKKVKEAEELAEKQQNSGNGGQPGMPGGFPGGPGMFPGGPGMFPGGRGGVAPNGRPPGGAIPPANPPGGASQPGGTRRR